MGGGGGTVRAASQADLVSSGLRLQAGGALASARPRRPCFRGASDPVELGGGLERSLPVEPCCLWPHVTATSTLPPGCQRRASHRIEPSDTRER